MSWLICSNRCCKHNERIRTLEKSDDLFAEELNVKNMLEKIRKSYDILRNVIDDNKFYLKYSKNRVIDLNTTEEEESAESEDESNSDSEETVKTANSITQIFEKSAYSVMKVKFDEIDNTPD